MKARQINLKSPCCWGWEYSLHFSTAFSVSVPSHWECLLELVPGQKALMVCFILLPGHEGGVCLFFSPACTSILATGYAFSVFTDVCVWQTFPFFLCDFSFQTICWRSFESTQWLQEETRSSPTKTLQEVKQRSSTVSSVFSFLWWDLWHLFLLHLAVHTVKNICLLTCWYSMKTYWVESEGLYSVSPYPTLVILSFSIT